MTEHERLKTVVKLSEELLAQSQKDLLNYESKPENNRFNDLDTAKGYIESKLYRLADEACEGSYCRGDDEYTRQFYVNDDLYEGTLSVDYGRHDKTYYFIDETYFEVEKVTEQ